MHIWHSMCNYSFWFSVFLIQKRRRQIPSAIQKRETCNFSAFKKPFVTHCQREQGKTSIVTLVLKAKMDLNSCLGFLQCMFVLFSAQHCSFQAVLTTTSGEVVCLFPCVLVNHTVLFTCFQETKKILQVLLLNWLPHCDTSLLHSACFEWFCLGLVVKAERKKNKPK